MRPEVQSILGRYRLGEAIGAGGMGTVVRATDEVLGREVAVKLLREELVDDERSLMRFRREARIAASLSHPGIAAVYDFAEDDGRPAIVMELLDGQDLHTVLERQGPMEPSQVTAILAQAADALAYAHSLGAVHRDVKPANIFLTRSGAVKVTDFGVAYAAGGGQLTTTGALIGTPDYLSPEQVRGDRATAASDVYSLGCVAYQLLTGQPPFTGDNSIAVATARLDAPPPSARAQVEAVPEVLDVLIRRAMAPAPGDRFPSAAAMAKALRAVSPSSLQALTPPPRGGPETVPMAPMAPAGPPTMVEGAPVAPGPETPPAPIPASLPVPPGRKRRGRWTWVWATLIVIVLAGMTADVIRSWQHLNIPKALPTWTGLSFDQASAAAQRLGFHVARSDTDDVAPQGRVLQTAPPAGAKLKAGATVTFIVSRGNQANVPDVKTMNVDDAKNLLQGQGFNPQVSDQTVPGPVDGQVAAQDPPSGTAAMKGSTVTLTLTTVPQGDNGDNGNGNATPNPLSSLFNSLFGGTSPSPTPPSKHHGGNG